MNILNIVLIETSWNVKVSSGNSYSLDSFGINRNIVECKVKEILGFLVLPGSINRNIVECKEICSSDCRRTGLLY